MTEPRSKSGAPTFNHLPTGDRKLVIRWTSLAMRRAQESWGDRAWLRLSLESRHAFSALELLEIFAPEKQHLVRPAASRLAYFLGPEQ